MHCLTTARWTRSSLENPPPLRAGYEIGNTYLDSKSGNRLGVWFVETPKAKRIVLFIHGQLGSRDQAHRREALEFFANKLEAHVVTYDPSGYADSTGWPSVEHLHSDAQSVLEFAIKKFAHHEQRLPLYVWGHSLGGPVAVNLANGRSEISGIFLEATFARLCDALTLGIYGFPLRWLGERHLKNIVESFFGKQFDTEVFIRNSGSAKPPIFILHGSGDWTIRANAVPRLAEACEQTGRACQSFIVQGGWHNNLHTSKWADTIAPVIMDWINKLE
jgi:alpha-beta hydrolase superfamily lysophospholipase